MLLAAVFAIVSVMLGLALGLGGRPGALGSVRAFAIGASLATVFAVLLPEALARGGAALLVFAAAVLLPSALERVTGAHGGHHHHGPEHAEAGRLGLEVSFVGLALHQVADGLAAGALISEGHARMDFLVSLAGHTVPVVAALVIAFAASRGPAVAAFRAALLAGAATLGIGLAKSPALSLLVEAHMPFIAAAAGGLLLHVVLHGVAEHPPHKPWQRAAELGALLLGMVLMAMIGDGHAHGHEPQHHEVSAVTHAAHAGFFEALEQLALASAPALLVGLAVVAALPAALVGHANASRVERLDGLFLRALPWSFLGVSVAAAIETAVAEGAFSGLGRTWVLVWLTLTLALPLVQQAGRERSMRTGVALLVLSLGVVTSGLAVGLAGSSAWIIGVVSLLGLGLLFVRVSLRLGVREFFAQLHGGHEHA